MALSLFGGNKPTDDVDPEYPNVRPIHGYTSPTSLRVATKVKPAFFILLTAPRLSAATMCLGSLFFLSFLLLPLTPLNLWKQVDR